MISEIFSGFLELLKLGGIVMALHVAMSIVAVAVIIFKLVQQAMLGVGSHGALRAAVAAWDSGDRAGAEAKLKGTRSHLAPLFLSGMAASDSAHGEEGALVNARLNADGEARMDRVESGYRLLDMLAQTAPLLGLLGTVVGMILAFRAMQASGGNVDPATLAGGIWVALLTTTTGLSIALPVTAILSFLEGRAARERLMAETVIQAALKPGVLIGAKGADLRHAA